MKQYKVFTHKASGERVTYILQSDLKIYDFCEWLIHSNEAPPQYGITTCCRIYASGNQSCYYEIYNHSKWLTAYGGAY